MDIVYNIRLTGASSTPSKKTGPVLDVAFNFDGRLKSGQHAVAQYQPSENHVVDFQVLTSRNGSDLRRRMKPCEQRDIIIKQLERKLPELLKSEGNKKENVSGTDSRTDSGTKGRVASGNALDAAARKAQAEKKIEEKLIAAHKRSNDMIGKVLANDPELRRYVTANTQPESITNASIAEAAVGQGSDDLLEIPSFLKRS